MKTLEFILARHRRETYQPEPRTTQTQRAATFETVRMNSNPTGDFAWPAIRERIISRN